jgi:hypothetical protein
MKKDVLVNKIYTMLEELKNEVGIYVNGEYCEDFLVTVGGEMGGVLTINTPKGNVFYIEAADIQRLTKSNGFWFLVVDHTDIVIRPVNIPDAV